MYRELAERPEEPQAPPRPVERYPISLSLQFLPLLGVGCVIACAIAYAVGGRAGGLWASVTFGCLFVLVLVVVLHPRVVEVDVDARQVRIYGKPLSFDEISHVTKTDLRNESSFVVHTNKGPLAYGKAVSADVTAAVAGINVALAAEYESVREMPEALAAEIRKLNTGFPLSRLLSLSETDGAKRLEEFLRDLPITDVKVVVIKDGVIRVNARSHDVEVTFHYVVRRDRLELIAPRVKSPLGHLELVRRENQPIGSGWAVLNDDVLINGGKSRLAFRTLPDNDQIASKMAKLGVRLLIDPEETRVVANDGLRGMRDPKTFVVAMLGLVGDVAVALRKRPENA